MSYSERERTLRSLSHAASSSPRPGGGGEPARSILGQRRLERDADDSQFTPSQRRIHNRVPGGSGVGSPRAESKVLETLSHVLERVARLEQIHHTGAPCPPNTGLTIRRLQHNSLYTVCAQCHSIKIQQRGLDV